MALNIKDKETDRLARALVGLTGESLTKAVRQSLAERLEREKRRRDRVGVAERLMSIGRRCADHPVLDDRPAEEIIGYDQHGLPR